MPQARAVAQKRARIEKTMDDLGLQRMGGTATFYFFISIEDYPGTSLDFALTLLLEDGISVVPGSAYGESTSRFVRLSIGTETEERIASALSTVKERIAKRSFDKRDLTRRMEAEGIHRFLGRS